MNGSAPDHWSSSSSFETFRPVVPCVPALFGQAQSLVEDPLGNVRHFGHVVDFVGFEQMALDHYAQMIVRQGERDWAAFRVRRAPLSPVREREHIPVTLAAVKNWCQMGD